jgi:hypothetical protein
MGTRGELRQQALDRHSGWGWRLSRSVAVWLALCMSGCPETTPPPPPDPLAEGAQVDALDSQGRAASAAFYAADPSGYWARDGLPPLIRLAHRRGPGGIETLAPLAQAFDSERFIVAVERRSLRPQELNDEAGALLGTAQPWEVWLRLTEETVARLDTARAEYAWSTPPQAEALTVSLRSLFDAGFLVEQLTALAPRPTKEHEAGLSGLPEQICFAGADRFSDAVAGRPDTGSDDDDTDKTVAWRDIQQPAELWNTTYNAACMALATGSCAAKLGLEGFGPEVGGKQWNDLSRELGAEPGDSGAPPSGLPRFFQERGYCFHVAWDGPLESACEEADAALVRGCDVLHMYYGPSGAGHVETVDDVTPDSSDDTRCTVETLSWGRSETVTYQGSRPSTRGGTFSGKSDGHRYAPEGKESYLQGSGRALFVYFCRCE